MQRPRLRIPSRYYRPAVGYALWMACVFMLSIGNALDAWAQPTDQPLAGTYDIGGGAMQYATVSDAALALSQWGVSGPTVFRVFPGTYNGPVRFDSIPGVGSFSPVTLVSAPDSGDVVLHASAGDSAVVTFSGCSYVTMYGLDIIADGSVLRAISITNGSHHLSVVACDLRGNLLSTGDAVRVRGPGCDSNVFSKLAVRRFADAFDLDGLSDANFGTTIEECRMDSVRRGIVAWRQDRLIVNANDILLNAGSVEEVDGVLIGTTWPQDTVLISGNRIHSITTSGPFAVGVRVRADSAAAVVRVVNNFIYDFYTTGSSQARAIFASSGRLELVANNINVNDSPSSGSSYAVLVTTNSSSGSTEVRDNILVNRELTNLAYNLFAVSNGILLSSDYNIFYGTGANYHLGRWGSDRHDLAAWRAAAQQDFHSLSGDPLYVSETDLHLSPDGGLAHLNGIPASWVVGDVDGDVRGNPPDIGADEYPFNAPTVDLALCGFDGLAPSYPELTPSPIRIIVRNRGSQDQAGIPLYLYFNSELVAETTTDLAVSATDTLTLTWTTPSAPASGTLSAMVAAFGDAVPANDTASAAVSIVPPPLNGTYTISVDGGYLSFAAAIADLTIRGISGEVVFEVSGTFNENVTVPPIRGADEAARVIFRGVGTASVSASSGTGTLILNGADHVVFDGINISSANSNLTTVQLVNGACDDVFENATVTGSSLVLTTARGIFVSGGGNHRNLFFNLTLSGAYTGMDFSGSLAQPDSANLVEGCTFETSRYAVRTTYANNALFHRNLIHTGYSGASGTCFGILIGSTRAQDAVYLEANNFTGGRASSACYAMRSDAGQGTVKIRNNFVSDWNVTGSGFVCGVAVASGNALVDFNSFWMNDVATTGIVAAITDSSSSTVHLRNNIFKITESDAPARALLHASGPLISDHNAFDVPSTNPQFALVESGGTAYASLYAWQSAGGNDINSLLGDPGFVNTSDLHILGNSTTVSGRGFSLGENVPDFDGELRATRPDIGADEYDVIYVTQDVGLSWITAPDSSFSANTDNSFDVQVWNAGNSDVSGVPVRLSFNEIPADSALINVLPGDTTALTLHWTAPDTALAVGELRAQVFLSQDQNPLNDFAAADVNVVGAPLSDTCTVGDSGNFPDLPTVIRHLTYRGVSGPVTVLVDAGTYEGVLEIPLIPGASDSSPVTFAALSSGTLLTADSGAAVVTLTDADHITLSSFNILATGSCPGGILLRGDADSNRVVGCAVAGSNPNSNGTFGVCVQLDQNDGNRLEHLTISDVYTAISFQNGPSSSFCSGNRVESCVVSLSRYGIYVDNQRDCAVTHCDIRPGSMAPIAGACYGVYVASLDSGGSCTVAANRIHGFEDNSGSTTNRAVGVHCGAAQGSVRVINNFIYDFSAITTLNISAIYLSIGANSVLHNSILLDDAPTANEISAIYISSGNDHDIRDNIIVSHKTGVASYGILCNGAGLVSDFNDIYGASPWFVTARLAGTDYPLLSQWQSLGRDLNSLAADPGFSSNEDLHIMPTDSVVNGRGVWSPLVLTDIDGQPRLDPPDIGADEYVVGIPLSSIPDLTVFYTPLGVALNWSPVAGAVSYSLYASSTPDVLLAPENFQATVTQTAYLDSLVADGARFYVVLANP